MRLFLKWFKKFWLLLLFLFIQNKLKKKITKTSSSRQRLRALKPSYSAWISESNPHSTWCLPKVPYSILSLNLYCPGTFLPDQWLRPSISTAGGSGSIPSQGAKIPHPTMLHRAVKRVLKLVLSWKLAVSHFIFANGTNSTSIYIYISFNCALCMWILK